MSTELNLLVGSAFVIGFAHTILGPDHYLPFVMMSWSRKWSSSKTALITGLCGLGHVASSVVLGLLGAYIGVKVGKLEFIEAHRGNLAAWVLIGFGLAYMVWGLRRAYRNKPHSHKHLHADLGPHSHQHSHHQEHVHVHDDKSKASITPWALFVIFVLGPCEPLIPMLMYPAAKESTFGMIMVAGVFSVATISTMLAAVMFARAGVSFIKLPKLEKYSHAIAGGTICLCGLAIKFLGL